MRVESQPIPKGCALTCGALIAILFALIIAGGVCVYLGDDDSDDMDEEAFWQQMSADEKVLSPEDFRKIEYARAAIDQIVRQIGAYGTNTVAACGLANDWVDLTMGQGAILTSLGQKYPDNIFVETEVRTMNVWVESALSFAEDCY